jgi:hypothetical protein
VLGQKATKWRPYQSPGHSHVSEASSGFALGFDTAVPSGLLWLCRRFDVISVLNETTAFDKGGIDPSFDEFRVL